MSFKLEFFPIPAPVFATYAVGGVIPNAQFIRFAPGANMTDSEIEDTKAMLEATGATVKILPKVRVRKTIAKVKLEKKLVSTPRTVVKTLIENSNSKNKKELDESCRKRMDDAHV